MNPWVAFAGPTSNGGRKFEFCFEFVVVLYRIEKMDILNIFRKLSDAKGKQEFEILNKISKKK
jgi:hypothetical protein